MITKLVKKFLFPALLIIAILFGLRFALQMLIVKHDTATLAAIDREVAHQKNELVTVADITRQNASDAALDIVVKDCNVNDRSRFDTLLDALSKNISTSELNELHTLFYKCANFYAERKSVSTLRLSHDVDTYLSLKKMRNQIQSYPTDISTEATTWHSIVDAELKWSSYFSDLVTYQESIINYFLAGKNAQSPEVLAVLEKVKNARAQMEVLGSQISQYRSSLASI